MAFACEQFRCFLLLRQLIFSGTRLLADLLVIGVPVLRTSTLLWGQWFSWNSMEIRWKSMGSNGNPWNSRKIHESGGNPWSPMEIFGIQWKSNENQMEILDTVEIHRNPIEILGIRWKWMESNGNQWNAMEIQVIQRKSMEFNGNPWKLMGIYGVLWKTMESYGNPWKSIRFCRSPWNPMETDGNLVEMLGTRWKSMESGRNP